MKAIHYTRYGPPEVLHLVHQEKPVPRDTEIRVRIHATAVNSGDVRLRKADPFAIRFFVGLIRPTRNILGAVFSGEVDCVGAKVKRYQVGDPVFGFSGNGFGSYAEYSCLPEDSALALKPFNLTHAEAAAIPFGGSPALHFIRKANIKPGQRVLIHGASGAIGSLAVQLAVHLGAEVTGVCSTKNTGLVKSLGAEKVIDYERQDFAGTGDRYDVILDTSGNISFRHALKSLTQRGVLILCAAGLSEMLRGAWISLTTSMRVLTGVVPERSEDMSALKDLVEAQELRPVIDRNYMLEQTADAHRYIEHGMKSGNVIIHLG